MTSRDSILLGALGLIFIATCPVAEGGMAPAIELKWDQLVPPTPPKPPKSFFADRPVDLGKAGGPDDGTPAPPPRPEAAWMSGRTSSVHGRSAVVPGLDGKRVHIGGYVVPLDFDATNVKEFLLVPFVGACIHVPPPPANQIIYVKAAKGFDVKGSFDPVWVTGTLKVLPAFTELADAGYSLDAEAVELRDRR